MEILRHLLPNLGDLLKLVLLTMMAIFIVLSVMNMANAYQDSVEVNLGIESVESDPDDPW